jgi:hypothetical protein
VHVYPPDPVFSTSPGFQLLLMAASVGPLSLPKTPKTLQSLAIWRAQ